MSKTPRKPKIIAPRQFELSNQTLQICHQALAAVPASNAQQARVLASALTELEFAIARIGQQVAKASEAEAAKE